MTSALPLPIQDGYYRIRSTAAKLAITMKYRPDLGNRAHNTTEADVDDGSQAFYIRHNSFTDTYTILNIGTGLYLGTTMKAGWDAWGTMGVVKPVPWKMNVVDDPKVGLGYRIFLTGHAEGIEKKGHYVSSWDGSTTPGDKVGITWWESNWHWIRGWKFEPIAAPGDQGNIRPLITLPPLLPGIFRIQNVGAQTVMDQSDEDPGSPILCNKPKKTKKSQEWTVSIDRETQLFYLKGVNDAYMAIDPTDSSLISSEKPQLWDIRQGEQPEQYLFQLPGVAQVLYVQDVTNNFMNIIAQPREPNKPDLERWVFMSRTVDVTQVVQSTPPIFPPLCNGTYRIVNNFGGGILVESDSFVPKADHTGRIVPKVNYKSHDHGNNHELWIVEVQPKVLSFTIRNLASGRYLAPPYMAGRDGASKTTCVYTTNLAYLWDIRHAWLDSLFTIQVPGTMFTLYCDDRNDTELCMWTRAEPPNDREQYRFHRVGDWAPALFPHTYEEIEALSSSSMGRPAVPELVATPSVHREAGWLEVVIDYMQKTLKIEGHDHKSH